MPFFMDIHTGGEEVDPDVIREAHLMDKAIEHKYGVTHIHYYVNIEEGMGFCLMSGPDKETCAKVHKESHGDVASNIIEVEKSTYEIMMGKSKVDHSDMVQRMNGIPDTGYRFILYAELIGLSDTLTASLEVILKIIVKHGGRVARSTSDQVVASFSDCNNACDCTWRINQNFQDFKKQGLDLKVGLVTDTPVTQTGIELFEDALNLATRLAKTAPKGTAFASSNTAKFYKGEFREISRSFCLVNKNQEQFINQLCDNLDQQMESGYASVDKLCNQMGISRPQMYRKVLALSGCSPKELIKELRLSIALGLIKTAENNISEIAFQLGYSQPAIFSKQFKSRFGTTPSKAQRRFISTPVESV